MHVIDHGPHSWFLFRDGEDLLLDVYCDHGMISYSVLIPLTAAEAAEYASQGHAAADRLSQAVQDSGPGGAYQRRNITAARGAETLAAVQAWRAAGGEA